MHVNQSTRHVFYSRLTARKGICDGVASPRRHTIPALAKMNGSHLFSCCAALVHRGLT